METFFVLIHLYVLLLHILSTNCVNINLDEYNKQYSNTKCKSSLIVNKDYFVMNGSVDFSDAGSSWDKLVTVQAQNSPRNDFKEICLISTSVTENKVTPDSCYCNNCSGDIKHFIINRTAGFQYSKAEIKVLVQSSDGSNSTYSIKKLPEMISLDKTTSILSADGEILTHENCWPNSTLTASKIRLCCHSGDEPCTSVIYNKGVNSSGSSCTGVELTSSEIANLTFQLEICGEVLQTDIQSCKIKGKTAENNGPTDNTTWILVGVLVPVCLVGLIIIILMIIFRKKIKTLWKDDPNELHERNSHTTNQVDALMAAVHSLTPRTLAEVEPYSLKDDLAALLTKQQQLSGGTCYWCRSKEHCFIDCPSKAERNQQQGNTSPSASESGLQSHGPQQN